MLALIGVHRRGLTLIETLVVTGVILILVGLTSSVIVSAKERAKVAISLNNLRQLGQAAAMYEQATGGWALRTKDLVTTRYVPAELCSAPADRTNRGWANEWISWLADRRTEYKGRLTHYRNSYLGLGDLGYGIPYYLDKLQEGTATGWLVDLSEGRPEIASEPAGFWAGSYRRLLFDTSVARRTHAPVWTPAGRATHPLLMFLDADEKWKQELCK